MAVNPKQPLAPVDWIEWTQERPETPGTYLTAWSDGTVETYPIDQIQIQKTAIQSGPHQLTHWAANVAGPVDN